MGVLDKFLDVMKLNDDYDDDYYEDDEDFEEEEEPRKKSLIRRDRKSVDDYDDYEEEEVKPAKKLFGDRETSKASKITPIREAKPAKKTGMEVCLMRPTSVEDSRTIAETILANSTVVLNLEGLDIEVAQRIIDFASGACFALGGNLQKVSQYIFLLTPETVDISGEMNDLIGDGFGAAFGKSF